MALTIGPLTIEPIHDGVLVASPMQLVPGSTEHDWERHVDLLRDDGQLELAVGGFLIRGHDERIVLVDAGFGVDDPRCGQLTSSLRAAGVDPSEVTDVVLTHLHRDHVGGVTEGGKVTFPNATYRCHAADWAYFAGDRVPDVVAPGHEKLSVLLGRLEPWDSDCTILPGLSVLEAPGHTPGSSLIVLSDDDERLMLLGDVIPCAVNLLEADWAALADVDQQLASRTRANVIREIEDGNVLAAGGHFPGLQFGRILEGRGTKRVVFETPQ